MVSAAGGSGLSSPVVPRSLCNVCTCPGFVLIATAEILSICGELALVSAVGALALSVRIDGNTS
jgi:hypothetical protein